MAAKIEVRTPLFDRLVDRDLRLSRELRPTRTLDRRGLRESVRQELEQLLNTRCPFPANRLTVRTVIDYGVPDFTVFSPRNLEDRKRVAEMLERTIRAFEPRLDNPRVFLDQLPGNDLALGGVIEANMIVDGVPEPVSFMTVLQMKEGTVEVHAGTR